MKDLPDHVNRHRSLRPDELPRRYRRLRFEDTDSLARERELDPEHRHEFDDDFWDPWLGHYYDDVSSSEMLHRIAWEMVFERGTSIAMAVPPEKWARMEALLAGQKDAGSRAESLPRSRQPDSTLLASRLRDRLNFLRTESAESCGDLLRSEMRLINTGQLADLISLCQSRHPADVTSLQQAVTTIMLLRPFWVRSLSSWKMPDQHAVEAFDSLLAHLFVEYPVPPFLYEAWTVAGRGEVRPAKWIAWFVLLGQGASLHRASDAFGWHAPEGLAARLMEAPRTFTPFEACAWAEVHRLGGTPVEFHRIRAHPAFAIDLTEPFGEWDAEFGALPDWFVHGREFTARFLKFWRETIPWLARHRDHLDDDDCPVILAWAAERARVAPEGAPFSWRGRTPCSCLRHAALAGGNLQFPYRNLRWRSKGWNWELRSDPENIWSIRELTSEKALHEEGARMGHCVALYADRCFAGQSSIFSLAHRGEPCLTIEVSPVHRHLAQLRGFRNRLPSAEESAIVERWTAEILRAQKPPQP
jgi:PcfJ-like protein